MFLFVITNKAQKHFLIALRARHKPYTTNHKSQNLSFTPKFSTTKTTKRKPHKFCHTERSEVSIQKTESGLLNLWIFRYAQNDSSGVDFRFLQRLKMTNVPSSLPLKNKSC